MQPQQALAALLADAEQMQHAAVRSMEALAGGSINRVYKVELSSGTTLVFKWNAAPPPGFFAAEADGLRTLQDARALRIPRVYAAGEHGILLEWLPSVPQRGRELRSAGRELGEGLAKLHRAYGTAYGYPRDNFIGTLPQGNRQSQSWTAFYRDHRLRPQLQLAERLGYLHATRRRLAERLLDRLPRFIDESAVRPSLLHGDLWAGNWLETPDGPALIDPAVYYGDREVDLAMAHLFGGFPRSFFESYAAHYPLAPGHEERRPIYQLYYLLVHLNLFGEAYGPQVDRVLVRYGG